MGKLGIKTRFYYCADCNKEVSKKGVSRCKLCWSKTRLGNRHPLFGKKPYNYIGKRWACCDCNKDISYGMTRCKKCARKGNLNPKWKNGSSFEPYTSNWTLTLKESIRERDKFTCQECGLHQDELCGMHKKLDIHHIDYNKNNCSPDNLVTLCKSCHSKTNENREYWINYFYKNGGLCE